MAWYIAKSLEVLRAQLNALAPRRSTASDGGIGDDAHSAHLSDHNPTASGQVCARDFTHDPAGGLDCHRLVRVLVASRDPRVKYVIWNRQILDTRPGFSPWQWKPYSGVNPHTKHLHLSVHAGAIGDQTGAWDLGAPTEEDDMTPDQSRKLDALHEQFTASRSADQYPGWPRVAPKAIAKATLVDFIRQSYEDLQALKAQTSGLTAAVAALSNDRDLTKDEVAKIVQDAVQQNIQITGTVEIGPAQ